MSLNGVHQSYLAKAVERGTILSEYVESQIDRLAQVSSHYELVCINFDYNSELS